MSVGTHGREISDTLLARPGGTGAAWSGSIGLVPAREAPVAPPLQRPVSFRSPCRRSVLVTLGCHCAQPTCDGLGLCGPFTRCLDDP